MTYTAADDRYTNLPYRRCGRSGLLLPEVSLGLWQNFGDGKPIEDRRAILRRAFDLVRLPYQPLPVKGQWMLEPARLAFCGGPASVPGAGTRFCAAAAPGRVRGRPWRFA